MEKAERKRIERRLILVLEHGPAYAWNLSGARTRDIRTIAHLLDIIEERTSQRDHGRAWAERWRWNALGELADEPWPTEPEPVASDGWSVAEEEMPAPAGDPDPGDVWIGVALAMQGDT